MIGSKVRAIGPSPASDSGRASFLFGYVKNAKKSACSVVRQNLKKRAEKKWMTCTNTSSMRYRCPANVALLCDVFPMSWTHGSIRARCRTERSTIPSTSLRASRSSFLQSLSPKAWTRHARGSTTCMCSAGRFSGRMHFKMSSSTALSWRKTARKCRRSCRIIPTPWRSWIDTVPMRSASICFLRR